MIVGDHRQNQVQRRGAARRRQTVPIDHENRFRQIGFGEFFQKTVAVFPVDRRAAIVQKPGGGQRVGAGAQPAESLREQPAPRSTWDDAAPGPPPRPEPAEPRPLEEVMRELGGTAAGGKRAGAEDEALREVEHITFDKSGALAAIVLGEDEVSSGTAKVKVLATGEQREIARTEIAAAVKRLREPA